jgi:hypothetical protein
MSDESAPAPENLPAETTESAPRARRVSTPRPKKAAKTVEKPAASPDVASESVKAPPSAPAEERNQEPSEDQRTASAETGWPEPEAASTGASGQSEGAKRKRRRRKGKGQSSAMQSASSPVQEYPAVPVAEPNGASEQAQVPAPRPQGSPAPPKGGPPPHQAPRPKVDPELLTKMAWKIYLAEVSEEGVALIGDNDAKDLSRRCFRLAEIFIEEQSRRR